MVSAPDSLVGEITIITAVSGQVYTCSKSNTNTIVDSIWYKYNLQSRINCMNDERGSSLKNLAISSVYAHTSWKLQVIVEYITKSEWKSTREKRPNN